MFSIYLHGLFLPLERGQSPSASKVIKPEQRVISAALLACDLMCALLGVTEEQLHDMSKQNASQLLTSKVYLTNRNKSKGGKSKKDLEAVGDRMGPGGLIEGWVVTEEMKLETLNRDPKASCDLMMLKSDFLVDLAETLFKHQK